MTASSQDDPEKPPVQETAPSNGQKPKKKEETSPPKEAQKESPPGARLEGKLTGSDRKTPLPGARLHAVSKDGKVFSSAPADARGRYTLPGVPPGAYQLAISTDDGVFILESEVGIASSNAFSLDLATVPAEAATGRVPGIDLEARGFATIVQGKRKEGGRSFWGGPKGIVLLAVSAGAVALILSNSDDPGEDSVSPSLP